MAIALPNPLEDPVINAILLSSFPMTKAAVTMLTKRLAFDLMNWHVRVNAIASGWIESDMTVGGKSDEEVNKLRESFKSKTELNIPG